MVNFIAQAKINKCGLQHTYALPNELAVERAERKEVGIRKTMHIISEMNVCSFLLE